MEQRSTNPTTKQNIIPTLEICCFNFASLQFMSDLAPVLSIPIRIELCDNQHVGGTMPLTIFAPDSSSSAKTISRPRITNADLEIRAMIRPHTISSMGFVYTPEQFTSMKADMRLIGETQVARAFVFGILTQDGKVDEEKCRELMKYADTFAMGCVFHRAFDEIVHKEEALEVLVACGFKSVLTSGGPGKASGDSNCMTLKRLVDQADGRIEIIVGGGVRSGNLEKLLATGASAYHSSALVDSGFLCPDVDEVLAIADIIKRSSIE